MSIPSNVDISVKEEISDTSFVQKEENLNIKKEPVDSPVSIKKETNNILSEYNADLKSELHGKIKQDNVLHECIKEEISFQSHGNNLKEGQPDPLAINCGDIGKVMKEDVKEEITTSVRKEYGDIECNTDVIGHKLESPVLNNYMVTNIYGVSIPTSGSNGRDTISVRDQNIHKQAKKYKCNECHKMLSTNHSLKRHIKNVHRRIKNYECDVCHKFFSQAAQVWTHFKNVHKNKNVEKPFTCSLKIDTDKRDKVTKEFECNICHKVFSQKVNLKLHILNVHEKSKNFECKQCHKLFFFSVSLKVHINNVHKYYKKYECSDCNKMFSSFCDTKRHIDNVHKEIKIFECIECHKKFCSGYVLKSHIKTVHKKN